MLKDCMSYFHLHVPGLWMRLRGDSVHDVRDDIAIFISLIVFIICYLIVYFLYFRYRV